MHCYFYFAYGSNMNTARVAERGLVVVAAQSAVLGGYRLLFDKHSAAHAGTGHANVVYHPDSVVEGVLYTLADPAEILKMDPFEKAPVNYSRDVVEVETTSGRVATWTYFANAAVRRPGLIPSRSYLDHLLAGEPYLSRTYFRMLSNWACREEC
jgi:gamma-glutamylcyclotransferase (GGCT)/AIG2-like uncharacterized protein YtfP